MNGGVTRDVWSAIAARHRSARAAADRRRRATARCRPKRRSSRSAYLARDYLKHPPPAQFHFIVSPLVMWIWIGGLIVFVGGLIALWPAPSTRPPRGSAARARPARCAAWPAPEARAARRSAGGCRDRDPHARAAGCVVLVVSAPLRAAAARRAAAAPPSRRSAERAARARARWRRPARPSTARSATPSSTTAPASSRRGLRGDRRAAARRGARDPRPARARSDEAASDASEDEVGRGRRPGR